MDDEKIELIRQNVLQAGNDLMYLNTMSKYMNNDLFNELFAPIYFAMQQDLYICLAKLVDSGNKKKETAVSINTLIKSNDTEDKKYHKMLSKYHDDVESNKIFAHNITINNQQKLFDDYPVKNVEGLLKTITEIIIDIDSSKAKAYYTNNANQFDRYMKYFDTKLKEVSSNERRSA